MEGTPKRAELVRTLHPAAAERWSLGGFIVDVAGRAVTDAAGRDVRLRRAEFELLLAFIRAPGRVLSRDHLLDAVVGRQSEPFDRSIDVLMGRLRKHLECDPKRPQLIVTVPGVGYKLAVRPTPAPEQQEIPDEHLLAGISACTPERRHPGINGASLAARPWPLFRLGRTQSPYRAPPHGPPGTIPPKRGARRTCDTRVTVPGFPRWTAVWFPESCETGLNVSGL
jgi:DNA-binding winged helix-turn-helix (wHTH) protein